MLRSLLRRHVAPLLQEGDSLSALPPAALQSPPAVHLEPQYRPCARPQSTCCSFRSAASRCSSEWLTRSRSLTRAISASSCCSMCPDVIACFSASRFSSSRRSSREVKFLDLATQRQHAQSLPHAAPAPVLPACATLRATRASSRADPRALLAAGDRHVVEALARLRQEERIWILQRQFARQRRIRNDVSIAQLGKNHFQRLAKPVQHPDRIFQRDRSDCPGGAECAASSTTNENLACESSGCTRKVARPSTSVRSRRSPSSAASHDFTTM